MTVRRNALTGLAVVVATTTLPASAHTMDRVAFEQLPHQWARLLPSASQISGSQVFPVVKPPPDGGELLFALPGRTVIEPQEPWVDQSDAATGIQEVSRTYSIREMALWTGSDRELRLWRARLDVTITCMFSEPQARQRYAEAFDASQGSPVSVGAEGHTWTPPVADEYRVTARVGRFILNVGVSLQRDLYREAARRPMQDLMLEVARDVANRLATGPTPGGGQTRARQTAAGAGTDLATGGQTAVAPIGGTRFQPQPLSEDSAIRKAVICLGFDERSQLTGAQETFPAGTEKVALYLEIEGARPNSEIQGTWYRQNQIIGRQLLIVSGDRKSISYVYAGDRTALWPGPYVVELRENGTLVARLTFRIQE